MKLGKIKVLDIVNVHDSGILLNPQLAAMQVHGGMSMGMGCGLPSSFFWMKNRKTVKRYFVAIIS